MHIGEVIRRKREEQELTGFQLAVKAGMTPSAVSQIETGKRTPNSASVVKLADALGVEVGDLFPKGQAPLPDFEGTLLLEASDDEFAEMVQEADEEQLAAMKRELKEHLPGGGPAPEIPTEKGLLAIRRSIAVYQEQKKRHAAEEPTWKKLEELVTA